MDTQNNLEEAIEVLQQLGLKEYEARCFVGLSRLDTGTAKDLSETTEVPRTRVYDAIRVLEAQGLVEIQHSSPQRFRAVPIEEAVETLRDQYDTRVERLRESLNEIEMVDTDGESPVQQVWTMRGQDAIESRTNRLIREASDEIVLVVGDGSLLTSNLVDALNAVDDGIDILLGAADSSLEQELRETVSGATVFVTGLEWLQAGVEKADDTRIGRLMMVDRSTILVSTITADSRKEQAIFGDGFGNGLVVIARRLMAQGLGKERTGSNGTRRRRQ